MKTTMDKNTILFVLPNRKSLAFNIDFFNLNHDKYTNALFDPLEIFYKMGETADTWIDYKRAIQHKTGTYEDRLNAAFADPDFRIVNLKKIPAVDYYDAEGLMYAIPPFDGSFSEPFWLKRKVFDSTKISWVIDGDDLVVTFAEDINNAIISVNSLFYHFELDDMNIARFRNIVDRLPLVPYGDDFVYNITLEAYEWESLKKTVLMTPVTRDGEWLKLYRPIEKNCFITYNGLIYDYELDDNDKSRIKLINVPLKNLELFDLDRILIYEMQFENKNLVARYYVSNGIGNKYKGTVDFALPITDSVILYNGVDAEYEVVSEHMILYPQTLFSVSEVSVLSQIQQINFMSGM